MLGRPFERGGLGSVENCRAMAAIAGRCDWHIGRFDRMAMERHAPHRLEVGGMVRSAVGSLGPIADRGQQLALIRGRSHREKSMAFPAGIAVLT